jgi:hypothetical protein
MLKKKFLPLLILLVFSFGCNKNLVQTKQHLGSSKEALISKIGDPRLMIPNGEKGEILVYTLSEGGKIKFYGKEDDLHGNGNFSGTNVAFSKKKWNYVVFLVDLDDRVYHSSKKFYHVTPYNLEYMVLEKYGDH